MKDTDSVATSDRFSSSLLKTSQFFFCRWDIFVSAQFTIVEGTCSVCPPPPPPLSLSLCEHLKNNFEHWEWQACNTETHKYKFRNSSPIKRRCRREKRNSNERKYFFFFVCFGLVLICLFDVVFCCCFLLVIFSFLFLIGYTVNVFHNLVKMRRKRQQQEKKKAEGQKEG